MLAEATMQTSRIAFLVTAAVAMTLVLSSITSAKSAGSAQEQVVGTWQLVSANNVRADGSLDPMSEYGANPLGYLMYDRTGHMCVSLATSKPAHWANPDKPTKDEIAQTANDFFAYCGTYEVKEKQGDIIHRPEMSSWPHYIGTDQVRHFKLVADQLELSGAETVPNGTYSGYRIVWKRIR
jgi:hypothetical protein